MREIFESYLLAFLHPFKMADYCQHNIPLDARSMHDLKKLELRESVATSWVFHLVRGILQLLMLLLVVKLLNFETGDAAIDQVLGTIIEQKNKSSFLFFMFPLAISIIFYPLTTMVIAEIWVYLIKFFIWLSKAPVDAQKTSHSIVANALTSNLLCIIPIIGEIFQTMLFYFYLYVGIKKQLNFSHGRSIFVVSFPFVLLNILFLAAVCLIFLLLNN